MSAEAALDFVRTTRRRGGALPLYGTALLLTIVPVLFMFAATAPILALPAVAGTVLLGVLLKVGLRSAAYSAAIERAAALPRPVSAALIDGVLLLGTAESRPADWCAVPITEREQRHIRTLALPAAYVRRR